jgi:hypothetical protein
MVVSKTPYIANVNLKGNTVFCLSETAYPSGTHEFTPAHMSITIKHKIKLIMQ